MNENLNLVQILKDCPIGTKLYSPIYGDVEFMEVIQAVDEYPILIRLNNDSTDEFTKEGRLFKDFDGECMLFPSREQRDWGKFKLEHLKAVDAEPNLASVWHEPSEEPQGDEWHIAYIDVLGSIHSLKRPSVTFDTFPNLAAFAAAAGIMQCWAYIDDLLPKQFGNSEQLKRDKQ